MPMKITAPQLPETPPEYLIDADVAEALHDLALARARHAEATAELEHSLDHPEEPINNVRNAPGVTARRLSHEPLVVAYDATDLEQTACALRAQLTMTERARSTWPALADAAAAAEAEADRQRLAELVAELRTIAVRAGQRHRVAGLIESAAAGNMPTSWSSDVPVKFTNAAGHVVAWKDVEALLDALAAHL